MERYYYFVDIDSVGVKVFKNLFDDPLTSCIVLDEYVQPYMYIIGSDQTEPIPFEFLSGIDIHSKSYRYINADSPLYEKKEICFADIITKTLASLKNDQCPSPIIRIISRDENLDYIVKYYYQKGINIRREPSFLERYDVLSSINILEAFADFKSHYSSKNEEKVEEEDPIYEGNFEPFGEYEDPNFSDMEKN